MKKIINGAKYDTTTAVCLGQWSNGCYTNDFNYCSEDLYRTKSGKYFLHGDGGANSKYCKWYGNNTRGGSSEIIPMTRAEAMEWAEEHLTTDEYEEAFGEVAEDDEVEVLNINIPASLKAKLQIEAENKGVSITAIVISTLSKMLDPVDVEIIVEHLQEMGATVVDDYTQEQLGDIQIELKKQGFDTYLQQADRLYLRVKEEN